MCDTESRVKSSETNRLEGDKSTEQQQSPPSSEQHEQEERVEDDIELLLQEKDETIKQFQVRMSQLFHQSTLYFCQYTLCILHLVARLPLLQVPSFSINSPRYIADSVATILNMYYIIQCAFTVSYIHVYSC